MHMTLIAPGSQGDVRPYVALGRGLQAAGLRAGKPTICVPFILISDHGLAHR
jgi:UDP:flavonoid glycosyltransferase YjiC (YdhE family)